MHFDAAIGRWYLMVVVLGVVTCFVAICDGWRHLAGALAVGLMGQGRVGFDIVVIIQGIDLVASIAIQSPMDRDRLTSRWRGGGTIVCVIVEFGRGYGRSLRATYRHHCCTVAETGSDWVGVAIDGS
jgi:hypothetical protein